jgi:hypothetical protein
LQIPPGEADWLPTEGPGRVERGALMEPGGHKPSERRLPPHQLATWTLLGTALVVLLGLFSVQPALDASTSRDYPSRSLPPDGEASLLSWEPPDDEYYPCSDCHEDEPANRTRRELEDEHDELTLAHGDLWCYSCHEAGRVDRLHLADETLVRFDDSWQLCTQCHGDKLADWRAGVHGKRTGHWRGPSEYRTCVACHSPHDPPFQPLEPKPPPRRPEQIASFLTVETQQETSHDEP